MDEKRETQWIVGVMGAAEHREESYNLARQVGRLIAERGAMLLNGGRGGVMEASARGAREGGGTTIGILKGKNRGQASTNTYIDIPIRTGLADIRNWVNVCACDGLIAIGGGWGTLSEIALARKIGKPVVLLQSWRLEASQEIEPLPMTNTPQEAVDRIFELMTEAWSDQ